MKILTTKQILVLHEVMLKKHGGSSGVRDNALLDSAINRPFATYDGEDLYPDLFSKLGALMQSIVKNHPFIDGNKRTAFISTFTILKENNYRLIATETEIIELMVSVANQNISVDEIATWLKTHADSPHPHSSS